MYTKKPLILHQTFYFTTIDNINKIFNVVSTSACPKSCVCVCVCCEFEVRAFRGEMSEKTKQGRIRRACPLHYYKILRGDQSICSHRKSSDNTQTQKQQPPSMDKPNQTLVVGDGNPPFFDHRRQKIMNLRKKNRELRKTVGLLLKQNKALKARLRLLRATTPAPFINNGTTSSILQIPSSFLGDTTSSILSTSNPFWEPINWEAE